MRRLSPSTPGPFAKHDAGLGLRLASLAGANAASVAALYLGQVLAKAVAGDFPASAGSLSLIPGATLAGYAIGVSAIAFCPGGKARLSVPAHLGLLAAALCSAGLAPTASALAIASIAVGAGAAVAQRLLAAAGSLGGATHGGAYIGKTIGVALAAVLATRLAGEVVSQLVGWRTTFFLAAAAAASFGLLNCWLQAAAVPTHPVSQATVVPTQGPLGLLWRRSALLRWAALQHAAVFAAYNLAWMVILVEVPAQERAAAVIGGGGTGIIAALLAGYCVDRFARRDLARYGAAAIAIATALLLPIAYHAAPGFGRVLLLLPAMALLDGGLQVALVANQARVQALLPNARPRLAAMLTVCGSLGGAAGAGLGYRLWQQFGWQAAIGLAATMGLLGLGFAMLAGLQQPVSGKTPADQGGHTFAAVPHRALLRGRLRKASSMLVRNGVRTA